MIHNKLSFDVAKRHSLALKFIVLVVIVLLVTMSASSYLTYQQQKQQLVNQLIIKGEMLGNFVSLVSPEAILGYDFVLMEQYMQEIAKRKDVLYAAVLSPTGSGLTGYFDPKFNAKLPQTNKNMSITEKVSLINKLPDTISLNFPIKVDGELLGIINVGLTTERINSMTKAVFLQNLLQTLAIILTLSVGIYFIFKRRVVIPVNELTTAVKRISEGYFDHKIGTNSKDELGVLGRGFDAMSEYLQMSYDELQEKNKELISATKAKSYFLANMSHEIRTPLTSVIGFAESLLDSELSAANRLAAINTIIRNGNYLQKIINDILDISKIEADKLEVEVRETSTFELFRDVCELVALQCKEKGLEFHINYDFPIPSVVYTDGLRLKQILVNLCSNAVKFTEHGSVYIDVSFSRVNHQLVISVADTGIGLTNSQMERIFKPFTQADSSTTRKFGGTGLGLTLTRQLTEMLGGSISVKSEHGKGSRFTFTIATGQVNSRQLVYSESDVKKKAEPIEIEPRKIRGRVLVVDDNPDNQRLIKFFLSNTELQLESVFNGMEAVVAVEKTHFDLIVIDMQMPVLNGIEAISKIRNKGFDGPIISISADVTPQSEEYARQAGCCEVLKKPIDKKKLLGYLYHHLVSANNESNKTSTRYRGRVLLAEDTPDNQRLVQLMFERWGVTLTVVEDGQQAVEAALANDYDLILMDMQMPIMGGVEATKKLIEAGCKTPIVALTANALKHDRDHYEKIGCAGFIAKPINRDAFEKVLAKFLHQEEMAVLDASLKIVRREPLPDEDKVTPSVLEPQKNLLHSVLNASQLVAKKDAENSQSDTSPSVSHSITSAGQHDEESGQQFGHLQANDETLPYANTADDSLRESINRLAEVLDKPLVKQFMLQVLKDGESHLLTRANAETPAAENNFAGPAPIYSSVLEDDPSMLDVVRQYISNLEKTKTALNQAVSRQEWDTVARLVHDIKGTGGAFGFPQLSETAKELDDLIKSRKYGEAKRLFENLNDTYNRILAARY